LVVYKSVGRETCSSPLIAPPVFIFIYSGKRKQISSMRSFERSEGSQKTDSRKPVTVIGYGEKNSRFKHCP